MPIWVCQFCDRLMVYWLSATPADFCRVSVLVVVTGWILSRPKRASRPSR